MKQRTQPGKILIIKLRAIGDVVLSTAVLPNLKAAFPDASIDFLVEPPADQILAGNPNIRRVVRYPYKAWARVSPFHSIIRGIRFIAGLRREKYSMVIDLFGNPRSAFLAWATGARQRVGFAFRGRRFYYTLRVPPRGDQVHEVEFNLDALRALNIPVIHRNPQLPVDADSQKRMSAWLDRETGRGKLRVALHVWGSWASKRWPLNRFAELADQLVRNHHADVILLWGPGEEIYAKTVRDMATQPLHLAPKTSLKELAELLRQCDIVVANDSGPMHMAAAVGTLTVGIYGPTSWQLQGPFGSHHRTAFNRGLTCLGCNRLDCSHMSCMQNLTVKAVMDVVEQAAAEAGISRRSVVYRM